MKELKVGFIGAGGRARSAHYPTVPRLEGVRLEAVAEMDEARMNEVAGKYGIPNTFHCTAEKDHLRMLDEVELDAVYVIMGPEFMAGPALDMLNAGKHVFIEKPAGGNLEESQALLEAAQKNNVHCVVGFQRRYAAVTREAMRLVNERGAACMAMGEFHKHEGLDKDLSDSLWDDICHVVDTVRFMIGSEAEEVHAYQDAHENGVRNSFNGLIRFANNAVGIITGQRASGGRYLRTELHGLGVSCYIRLPGDMEIYQDNSGPEPVTGAQITGNDPADEASYGGVLTMHQEFADCIRSGETPSSDIRDAIKTSILVDRLSK